MASKPRKHPPISWANSQEHQSNTVHLATEERRFKGEHYYKNFIQRPCVCLDANCLSNWKRWVDLDDDKRCGFVTLPLVPKKQDTHLGKAKMAFLAVVYRHLRGNGVAVPERKGDTRFYLAYHHYHPTLLQPNNNGPVPVVEWKQGKDLSFMDSDKLPAGDVVEKGYFAAPNYAMANVDLDLRVAERSAGISHKDSPMPATCRKTPREREVEQLERQAVKKPKKLVEAYLAVQDEAMNLRLRNKTLESDVDKLESANQHLEEELESMAKVFVKGGLTRQTFSSDSWHASNKGAANLLFGWRTWDTTKAWLNLYIPDLKLERRTEGCLSDFESVLAVMMCWKLPMKQAVAGLILDVDRSVITRKVQHWGPILAHRSRLLSNLDLQSDFDFLSETQCQELGIEHYNTADEKDRFASYIDAAMPAVFNQEKLTEVSLLVDGKDILTDSVQVDSGVNILMYSKKSEGSAARVLSWILAGGLNVYSTGLYLGRVSEERLVELHGETDSSNIRLPPS